MRGKRCKDKEGKKGKPKKRKKKCGKRKSIISDMEKVKEKNTK